MSFRTKLLLFNCLPLVAFVIISLMLGLTQFRTSLYNEKEGNLRSTAMAALTFYTSQGYGDYSLREDGNVWRGMNFNISETDSIVDDLKKETRVDITFFYGDTAAMTSIFSEDATPHRLLGIEAGSDIKSYTLAHGKQFWSPDMVIDGEHCQAYVIPIRQESNNAVIGALMASQSADGFNATIQKYIMTTVITMLLILIMVFFFIRWHVEWFAKKFSEVVDRSKQDLLTGLYNKITFENEVKASLSNRGQDNIAVLWILDFDNFKHVNDNYGHQIGDDVLKAFGKILNRSFRADDVIGRIGGDEFMVLMRDMRPENLKRADEIAEEILKNLYDLKIGDAEHFSCSIGIGSDAKGYDFTQLYQLADKALYEAKERGKACFVRYDSAEKNDGET